MLSIDLCHCGGLYAERLEQYFRERGAEIRCHVIPRNLPMIIDEPEEYLPDSVGQGDVVIAVNLHQDLLVGLPDMMAARGAKALIVPLEDPGWARPGLVRQVSELCRTRGIECSFPKPFCGLLPETPVIRQFSEQYQVGRPIVQLTTADGVITAAQCLRGAPCGLTAWVAQRLVGQRCDEDILSSVHHLQAAYPCLATMTMDPALGDTIMHLSVGFLCEAVQDALKKAAQ